MNNFDPARCHHTKYAIFNFSPPLRWYCLTYSFELLPQLSQLHLKLAIGAQVRTIFHKFGKRLRRIEKERQWFLLLNWPLHHSLNNSMFLVVVVAFLYSLKTTLFIIMSSNWALMRLLSTTKLPITFSVHLKFSTDWRV